MRKRVIAICIAVCVLGILIGVQRPAKTAAPPTTAPPDLQVCHYYQSTGPDLHCTPGAALNITVQQICTPGYATSVRPPLSYTSRVKLELMQLYGVGDQSPSAYELDHLVPLELGGNPTSLLNLWPEIWSDANTKDVQENQLHDAVCNGTMNLTAAQHDMSTWGGTG